MSSFEYTTSGDILRINLPDGNHVSYMWYLDHTIKSVTYPGNSTVETGYDLFGDVRWIEDAMGNRSGVRYDMLRQVSKTVRNLNGVEKAVEYEYNENGQVTKVTDQRGNSTRFDYDKQGNVWKIHYPPIACEVCGYGVTGGWQWVLRTRGRRDGFDPVFFLIGC